MLVQTNESIMPMAPMKMLGNMWFMLAFNVILETHKTFEDDTHVPKDKIFTKWYVQVVKAQQYNICLVTKVSIPKNFMC